MSLGFTYMTIGSLKLFYYLKVHDLQINKKAEMDKQELRVHVYDRCFFVYDRCFFVYDRCFFVASLQNNN